MNKLYIFTAKFCQPCKRLKESLAEVSAPQGVEIHVVDIEQEFELALKYGVRAAPTIVLTDDSGTVLNTWVGISDASQLKKVLGE